MEYMEKQVYDGILNEHEIQDIQVKLELDDMRMYEILVYLAKEGKIKVTVV